MQRHELPHPQFIGWADKEKTEAIYEPLCLEPFVTLLVETETFTAEVTVHPNRLDWFLENYPLQIQQEVKFTVL